MSWQVNTCHSGTRMFSQVARAQGGFSHEPGLTCHAPATHATGGQASTRMVGAVARVWDIPWVPTV